MTSPILRRVLPTLLVMASLATAVVVSLTTHPAIAADSPVRTALVQFDEQRTSLLAADARVSQSRADLDVATRLTTDARTAVTDLENRLAADRDWLGTMSAAAYIGQGSSDPASDTMMRVLTSATARIREDRRSLDAATRTLDAAIRRSAQAEATLARSNATFDQIAAPTREAGATLESELAAAGATGLTAPAYSAAVAAAEKITSDTPDCPIQPAVLAAFGRVMSNNGQADRVTTNDLGRTSAPLRGLTATPTPDTDQGTIDGSAIDDRRVGPMQLTPAIWSQFGADGDGDATANPDSLFDGALTVGRTMCARSVDPRSSDSLSAAVGGLTTNSAQAAAIMGTARHLARSTGTDMGVVPADPRQQIAMQTLASRSAADGVAGTSIDDVIAWARTRLGTPYSQCLGPDARPEDPECPPGTNRFGSGFFDCSGFITAAFARIGITLPSTTDAMAVDLNLEATAVSDRFDPEVARPGDVLLQDGHVSLYVGDGRVIHASGGQLTEENIPGWVRMGVFVVLRPTALP
jgi:cell wall-associated NlpC family hydrolase